MLDASGPLKPIYLLADSQLLFWEEAGLSFVERLRERYFSGVVKAAYVGASNGDRLEYYDLFEAAMFRAGIRRCRMILSTPSSSDFAALQTADLILLAGGDVVEGWKVFQQNGLDEIIGRRYRDGVLLMGVSAGAVQLGLLGWPDRGPQDGGMVGTFGLVPLIVDAHQERDDWRNLQSALGNCGIPTSGIGIPSGAGMAFHPDHSIQAIRHPLVEFNWQHQKLQRSFIGAISFET